MYERLEPVDQANGGPTRLEIDAEIPLIRFSCDLPACRGACCTLPGGRGAPVLDEELPLLQSVIPAVHSYLDPRNLDVLAQEGPVCGSPGDYSTTCIEDRDCVFVMYEQGVARCSIERAFLEGATTWRKPLSCHLFPIRIDRERIPRLRFELLHDCEPALRRGTRENTFVTDFVREGLLRAVGAEWYAMIDRYCRDRRADAGAQGGTIHP